MRELGVAQWQVGASRDVSENASQCGEDQPRRRVVSGVRQPIATPRNSIVASDRGWKRDHQAELFPSEESHTHPPCQHCVQEAEADNWNPHPIESTKAI